jgi:hypothetical protein
MRRTVKLNIRDTLCDCVNWIKMALDRIQMGAFVNTVLNSKVP